VTATKDKATVAYKGPVSWAFVGAAAAGTQATAVPDPADPAKSLPEIFRSIIPGSLPGELRVSAKLGPLDCTPAVATSYAPPPAGQLRVLVTSLAELTPISGAVVTITDGSGSQSVTTTEDGVASVTSVAGPATVTVTHPGHSWVTYVDTASKDLTVYLKPMAKKTGTVKLPDLTAKDYEELPVLGGNVHLSFYGPSITGNLFDTSLGSLLGDYDLHADCDDPATRLAKCSSIDTGTGEPFVVPLPGNLAIGLNNDMFKPDPSKPQTAITVSSTVGARAVWGFGGNSVLKDLVDAAGPIIDGGLEAEGAIGNVLTVVLPLVSKLQSGARPGVNFVGGSTAEVTVPLTSSQRLRLSAKFNSLGRYRIGPDDFAYDGVVVLGGAAYGAQGVIPLGLGAGVDQKGGARVGDRETGNGKLDPLNAGDPEGAVQLRLAPLHSGLETAPFVILAVAASLNGLTDGSKPVALSAQLQHPGEIPYQKPNDASKAIEFGEFMASPDPVVRESERKVTLVDAAADASFHRIDIGNTNIGEWQIWLPAARREYVVPVLPHEADRFGVRTNGKRPEVTVYSVRLNGTTYDDAVSYSANDLSSVTSAFAVRGVVRPRFCENNADCASPALHCSADGENACRATACVSDSDCGGGKCNLKAKLCEP